MLTLPLRCSSHCPGSARGGGDTHDACALIFALLLDKRDEAVRQKQLGQVKDLFGDQMAKATLKLSGDVAKLDPRPSSRSPTWPSVRCGAWRGSS
ncbi:MAG: hypothetical protein CM1200mP29_05490 [Verrucomicrobiota bacterium]|nr:MAG: hypothetical protein CM1200mP29_05490 [Verrucomicrobiota bacterium]